MYNCLEFFNKSGNSCNFVYNTELELWEGNIYITPRVSVGLFESEHIYLFEKVIYNDLEKFVKPHINQFLTTKNILAKWNTDLYEDNIFLFQSNNSNLEKLTNIEIEFDYHISDNYIDNVLYTDFITEDYISLNIALTSLEEGIFERDLQLIDLNTNKIFAQIYFYGEVVGEDERLKVLCNNLGYFINKEDEAIFSDSDIEEQEINYILLNQKRKEILLEGHNIYPFIGSYKGLINAINFFGFDDLSIREYWRNVNIESKDYGKFKQNEILEIFNTDVNLSSKNLDSKNYRKTNNIALAFQMYNVTNKIDEYDLPIVEENFRYTFEEVLIKLFGLKNKLKSHFLPYNINIKDIIAEGTYFTKLKKSLTISNSITDFVYNGINPKITLLSTNDYIIDLRDINELIKQYDFDPNFVRELLPNSTKTGVELYDYICALFKKYYPTIKDLEQLPDKPNIPIGCPITLRNDSFNISIKDIDANFLDLTSEGNIIMDFEISNFEEGDTFILTETISNTQISYTTLNTDTNDTIIENLFNLFSNKIEPPYIFFIPSIVVKNTKKVLRIYGKNLSYKIKYNFVTSTTNGLLSFDTQTFKKTYINFNNNYTIKNIGNRNFYELEWRIYYEDKTKYNFFIRGDVESLKIISVNLQYVGNYTVELILYDTNNMVSVKKWNNFINVKMKEVDFLGFYRRVSEKYNTIKSLENIKFNEHKIISLNPLIVNETKLKDCKISFRALDMVSKLPNVNYENDYLYTVKNFRPSGETSFPGPFTFKNLKNIQIKDLKYIPFYMTHISGDTPASFNITSVNYGGVLKIYNEIKNKSGFHTFTTNNLKIACEELNSSKDYIISLYNYSYIDNDDNNYENKSSFIHCAGKYFGKNCDIQKITTSNVVVEEIVNSRSYGFRCNDYNIINGFEVFNGVVYVCFSADSCKIPGKLNYVWTIKKIDDLEFNNVYYYTEYCGHLFYKKGKYNVELTITDNKGNTNSKNKNILIIN